MLSPRVCSHQHWRRRVTLKRNGRLNTKQHLSEFLNPLQSDQTVWHQHCHTDCGFLPTPVSPLLPHLSHGCVPEEVLDEFVCDRSCAFLAAPWLMDRFNTLSLEDGAQKTVACLNLCQVSLEMDQSAPRKRQNLRVDHWFGTLVHLLVLLLFDSTSLTTLSAVYQ